MDDFPGNSRKARDGNATEAKQDNTRAIVPIVAQGSAKRRKRSLGKRFKETFGAADARSVVGYVVVDVFIPQIKDMLADATSQGVEKLIFGEVRGPRRNGYRPPGAPYSYNRPTNYATTTPWSRPQDQRRDVSRKARETHSFDEIVLESRGEAEEVIDRMLEILSQYQSVSVADLYGMVNITAQYTDNKYGWTNLQGANVQHTRGGYLLNLPRPEVLET